jgi:hypothetical protein
MLRRLLAACSVLALPLAGGGCGTQYNMRQEGERLVNFNYDSKLPARTIFGGVLLDAEEAASTPFMMFGDSGLSKDDRLSAPLVMLEDLLDLPGSALCDMVTLPWTVSATFTRLSQPSKLKPSHALAEPKAETNGAAKQTTTSPAERSQPESRQAEEK